MHVHNGTQHCLPVTMIRAIQPKLPNRGGRCISPVSQHSNWSFGQVSTLLVTGEFSLWWAYDRFTKLPSV